MRPGSHLLEHQERVYSAVNAYARNSVGNVDVAMLSSVALAFLPQTLAVMQAERAPPRWAETQRALGTALLELGKRSGKRADVEQARTALPQCRKRTARSGDYEHTQYSMRAAERLLFGYVENAADGMWAPEEGSDERFNEMGFRVAVSLDATSWDRDAR